MRKRRWRPVGYLRLEEFAARVSAVEGDLDLERYSGTWILDEHEISELALLFKAVVVELMYLQVKREFGEYYLPHFKKRNTLQNRSRKQYSD